MVQKQTWGKNERTSSFLGYLHTYASWNKLPNSQNGHAKTFLAWANDRQELTFQFWSSHPIPLLKTVADSRSTTETQRIFFKGLLNQNYKQNLWTPCCGDCYTLTSAGLICGGRYRDWDVWTDHAQNSRQRIRTGIHLHMRISQFPRIPCISVWYPELSCRRYMFSSKFGCCAWVETLFVFFVVIQFWTKLEEHVCKNSRMCRSFNEWSQWMRNLQLSCAEWSGLLGKQSK